MPFDAWHCSYSCDGIQQGQVLVDGKYMLVSGDRFCIYFSMVWIALQLAKDYVACGDCCVVCGNRCRDRSVFRGGDCFIQAFMKQFSSYWFLWCYVVVMLLSPLINKALDACDNIKEALAVVLPVVILVFGWNWIFPAAAITLRTTLPAPSGFGSHTFLTLTGIYIAGRFLRKWLIGYFPTDWKMVIFCFGLMVIVSLDSRLGRYCSPFSVVLAACWVLLFKEVKIPAFAATILRFITPSLFAVYLLHVSNIGNSALVFLDEKCACVGFGGVRSIIVSLIVFMICIAADMPRRTLLCGFHRK